MEIDTKKLIERATREKKTRKNITVSNSLWKQVQQRIGKGVAMSSLIEILLHQFMSDWTPIKQKQVEATKTK
jgi:hypothetical protein